jgi:hypothetical protein
MMDNSNTKKRHALRDFWLSRSLEGGGEKQETLIWGFDELLHILKLRGSQHLKDILQFEIDRSGFTLGHRFGIEG